MEFEKNNCLPFLDVCVARGERGEAVTSVFRKSTFSGLYIHFLSFVPIAYKKATVKSLFSRARKICSKETLYDELKFLKKVLSENGYPEKFVSIHSKECIPKPTVEGPELKPVFISVPFMGDQFSDVVRRRLSSVRRVFPMVRPIVLFTTKTLPVRSVKDAVPKSCQSNLIYKFQCECGDIYVGRTERKLNDRVKEHLPKWTSTQNTRPRAKSLPSSSITRHIVSCDFFNKSADRLSHFSIMFKSPFSPYLKILEAMSILRTKPKLCVSKDFVMSLSLPW